MMSAFLIYLTGWSYVAIVPAGERGVLCLHGYTSFS